MYREIGNIIANTVEPHGYSVVRSYTGHGIGRIFHQAPTVPHYRGNKAVGFMKRDMSSPSNLWSTRVHGRISLGKIIGHLRLVMACGQLNSSTQLW